MRGSAVVQLLDKHGVFDTLRVVTRRVAQLKLGTDSRKMVSHYSVPALDRTFLLVVLKQGLDLLDSNELRHLRRMWLLLVVVRQHD